VSIDHSNFEAEELALVWLEEGKPHLVDLERVDVLDGLALPG
jgi:hypothetical protein